MIRIFQSSILIESGLLYCQRQIDLIAPVTEMQFQASGREKRILEGCLRPCQKITEGHLFGSSHGNHLTAVNHFETAKTKRLLGLELLPFNLERLSLKSPNRVG